jgi:CBS domain-containing protein
MLVADVMTSEVYTCSEDATAHDALGAMWKHDLGILPILDDANQVVGVVTDRDLAMACMMRGAAPHRIPVIDVTSQVVWHVRPQDTIESAERIMEEHQVRRLPVLNGAALVGMVTLTDLVRARSNVKPSEIVRTFEAVTHPRPRPSPNQAGSSPTTSPST